MAIVTPVCVPIPVSIKTPCVRFFGVKLCAGVPTELPPTPLSLMRSMMVQINSVLAPTQPIITILDTVASIFEAIKSVATLNPVTISEALEDLTEAMVELLKLLPAIFLPVLVKDIIDNMATMMDAFATYLGGAKNTIATLDSSQLFAKAHPNFTALVSSLTCQRERVDQALASASEGLEPVNSMIGAVNSILELLGLGAFSFPTLDDFSAAALDSTITLLQTTASIMRDVANLIPG